jgi:hypothetical protein
MSEVAAIVNTDMSGYDIYVRIWPDMAGRGPPMAVATGAGNPLEPQNARWVETRDPSWSRPPTHKAAAPLSRMRMRASLHPEDAQGKCSEDPSRREKTAAPLHIHPPRSAAPVPSRPCRSPARARLTSAAHTPSATGKPSPRREICITGQGK